MVDLFMVPAEMGGYEAAPDGGVDPKVVATSPLQSQMAEGTLFSEKDYASCLSLKDFTTNCNVGLMAYTNSAHKRANLYEGTDQSLADDFNYLSDVEYGVREFDLAYTSGGPWPVNAPGPMRIDAVGLGE
ncbi:hypothetical protein [Actinophytocola algeriensis]|uniref:Uncharacterized protein n=1 Tax=Actinophytocola algeriensis TaxID=1768010 RepID=A0A7W7VDT5_9PSEU|nr:hypothetical protein [Actinophytocola algeriensis]MBB4906419.1 hypothetical protein [Actinophytocola algeriensis]MBE1477900.1 hypothetical protein [Actinophytocola algeriensis]